MVKYTQIHGQVARPQGLKYAQIHTNQKFRNTIEQSQIQRSKQKYKYTRIQRNIIKKYTNTVSQSGIYLHVASGGSADIRWVLKMQTKN